MRIILNNNLLEILQPFHELAARLARGGIGVIDTARTEELWLLDTEFISTIPPPNRTD